MILFGSAGPSGSQNAETGEAAGPSCSSSKHSDYVELHDRECIVVF